MDTEKEYRAAREPTETEWRIRSVYLDQRRSVAKAAFELGIERAQVLRAVATVRWWLQDSGWSARYALAKSVGLGDSDARLHADMEAAYYLRSREGK